MEGQVLIGLRKSSQIIYLRRDLCQLFSCVLLFATPCWTAAHQTSLSITNSRSLLKFICIESVLPSNHLILCCPLLLPPSIFPSIRVFSNESVLCIRWPKYWSFSFSISPTPVAQFVKNLPAVQETWVLFLGWEDPLEKEMEAHSNVLAWRVPWTEEPSGSQTMGL